MKTIYDNDDKIRALKKMIRDKENLIRICNIDIVVIEKMIKERKREIKNSQSPET